LLSNNQFQIWIVIKNDAKSEACKQKDRDQDFKVLQNTRQDNTIIA
jgi:hypothetical protein